MAISLIAPQNIFATILLPASKSISNRALIIKAFSGGEKPICNLSDCDDTLAMQNALSADCSMVDIGAAGTAMRFLTAYLAQKEGTWLLTGSERMKQRPIRILVDALRQLGAVISYEEHEGFPPLKIRGRKLEGGSVHLQGNVSSQYVSALMMAAPLMGKGLLINLIPPVVSQPYIALTSQIMRDFGVEVHVEGTSVSIPKQMYRNLGFSVESDWSAASYWYEVLALRKSGEITLKGLRANSPQGDSKTAVLFEPLGVSTVYAEDGVQLRTNGRRCDEMVYDFSDEPDLAQTFAVTCCLLDVPFRFSGLQSLKIKETDRVLALRNELGKLGYVLTEPADGVLEWKSLKCAEEEMPCIETYDDHRMAMSFAPASLLKKIVIEHPEVVSKSYPRFWEDLQTAGFLIQIQ